MVLVPIFESLEISLRSDIPFTNDARINGTAISLRALIKMFPNGFIQSPMNPGPHEKFESSRAKITPAAIPSKICQCNANFFILWFYRKLYSVIIFWMFCFVKKDRQERERPLLKL